MRKLPFLCLCLVLLAPARAQYRRVKLDSLGLPAFPGAANIGHIGLPLASILKPEPGQKLTGPALTDLAINTYRTPLTVSVDRIARFYLKVAAAAGWRLLDDIPDSVSSRSLVFWSPQAPGYLTVEVQNGPNNTRQIDLTRLLGDVNPVRPGEVLRLTGKRVREQRVNVTYSGRFLDLKTNKEVVQTVDAIEERAEGGAPASAVRWLAPMEETFAVAIRVTDSSKSMTSVEVYAANGTKVAHADSVKPTGVLTMLAKVRATQGLTLRAVIMGVPQPPAPEPLPKPAPKAAAKPARKPGLGTPKPKPGAASALATGVAVPQPATAAPAVKQAPIVLTEWYGLRPPLAALPEIRRVGVSTKTDNVILAQDVEVGPTCDGNVSRTVEYSLETTDAFDFSPDLFGPALLRAPVGSHTSSIRVEFPQRSGTSNTFTLTQTKTTTVSEVSVGYSYQGEWVKLPSGKPNPTSTTYTVTSLAVPTIARHSSGSCPSKEQALKAISPDPR